MSEPERRVRHRHHRGLDHPGGGRGAAARDPRAGQGPDRPGRLRHHRRRQQAEEQLRPRRGQADASTARTPTMPHLDTAPVKALDEVVKVDYKIHGCPIDAEELALRGPQPAGRARSPSIPDYPVCVECKMKENVCRYEYDEICLGPDHPGRLRRALPLERVLVLRLPRLRGRAQRRSGHGGHGPATARPSTTCESKMLLFGSQQEIHPMSKTVDINVHHVTRVEGHGNIVVRAQDGDDREDRVAGARRRRASSRRWCAGAATRTSRPSSAASAASAR